MAAKGQEVPEKLAVMLLGSHVGKTSLIHRVVWDSFGEPPEPNMGPGVIEFVMVSKTGAPLNLMLFDCPGFLKSRRQMEETVSGGHGFLLFFDPCSRPSFQLVQTWHAFCAAQESCLALALVATRMDLVEQGNREVTRAEAEEFARSKCMDYFELSAQRDQGCHEPFQAIVDKMAEALGIKAKQEKKGKCVIS